MEVYQQRHKHTIHCHRTHFSWVFIFLHMNFSKFWSLDFLRQKRIATGELTRVMLWSPIILGLSAVVSSVLQSLRSSLYIHSLQFYIILVLFLELFFWYHILDF
jgi:hypothetical protein